MKKLLMLTLIILSFSSCEEEDDPIPVANYDNQIVFWSDFAGPPIRVSVEGNEIGTITAVSSSSPSCGSSGNITRTYSPGTRSFSATETDSPFRTWNSTFTISETTDCLKFRLNM